MVIVEINSDAKGSNPGGMCSIDSKLGNHGFYLKYCPGSMLHKSIPLTNFNQPIYELITFKLAEMIGLKIPPVYLLDNRNRHVQFHQSMHISKKLNSDVPFYFLSKVISEIKPGDISVDDLESRLNGMIRNEKFHRDLLLIDDIEGRRQNYFYDETISGKSSVIYLDLGCSFVRATQGRLYQAQAKKFDLTPKERKDAIKHLKSFYLRKQGDCTCSINLYANFIERIPQIPISTISANSDIVNYSCSDLLSPEELEHIQDIHIAWIEEKARAQYQIQRKQSESDQNYTPLILKG